MQPVPVPASRSPLVALVAVLLGVGLAKGLARVLALGVLLGVVVASVGALTVGIALLRLAVLR